MNERFVQVFTTGIEVYFDVSFSLRFFSVEPFVSTLIYLNDNFILRKQGSFGLENEGFKMKASYKELLERARAQLPQQVSKHERFEIPKVRSSTIGMRTVIQNYGEICNMLNREQGHLLKFLTREMATKAGLEGGRAIFQGKFPSETIDRLIERYVNEFVVCSVCKRPDTKIIKEKRFMFLVCEACGARSSIRPV